MTQPRDRRSSSRFVVPAAILTAVWAGSFAGAPASADTFTWNGNTGNFSDPTQWAGGAAPTGRNPNDSLAFPGSSSYVATNDIGVTSSLPAFYFGTLQLGNAVDGSSVATGGAGNPAAYPSQIMLRATTPTATINQTGAGAFTIAQPLNVAAGTTLTINSAAGAGPLYLYSNATVNTLTANSFFGEGTVTINNQSANPVYVGNFGGLSGNLNVTAGVVRVIDSPSTTTVVPPPPPPATPQPGGGDTIRNQTLITVASGATFDFNGNAETMGGIAGSGTILLGATGGIGLNYVSDLTWDGNIAQAAGGTGNVSKGTGSGNTTYTFRGDNTFGTRMTVDSGTLVLSGNGKFSGATNMVVSGGATLRLDNTTQNVNDRVNPAATWTLSGTLAIIGAPGQATSQTLGAVTPQSTAGSGAVINVVNGAGGGTTTLTVASLSRPARGTYVNFTGDGSVFITTPSALTNNIIGGWALVNGTDWATLNGSNQVVPFTAYQASPNTADWQATDNVKVTGPLTGTAAGTLNTLYLASADHLTLGGALTLTAGGILATATTAIDGTGSISSNNLVNSAANTADLITTVTGGNTLTVNVQLGNSPSNGLIKAGDGTLVLAATNTYNADTRIQGGTLSVASNANLGSGTNIRLSAGTLQITGPSFSTTKNLQLDGAEATVDTGPNNVTITGTVNNNGILNKTGAGTLILQNATATTTGHLNGTGALVNIQQGTIRLGTGDTIDNATNVNIAAGAVLDLSYDTSGEDFGGPTGNGDVWSVSSGNSGIGFAGGNNTSVTFAGRILPYSSGTPALTGGSVSKNGMGTVTLSGASTYTGTTSIGAGTMILAADALPGVPGPFGNATSAVLLGNTTAGDTNNASLMIGTAGVTLGRNVTVQTNATTPGVGVHSIGATHTSGTSTFSGNITLNRSVELNVAGGGTTRFTGVVAGSGGLYKVGAGAAVLTGANTYTGPTVVNAGTLTLIQPASLGAGPVAVNGGTLAAAAGMAGPLVPSSLALSGAGTLDLNDNDMILDYTGPSPLAAVRAAITAARSGGAWTGAGITSTSAKTIAGGTTTLAAVEASDLGVTSFDGVTVDATAVLVKYTYYGDLNLDGKINADDYALIDRGRAKGLSGWVNGDVDNSGSVTSADYLLMDNAFGHQTGTLSPEFLAMRESQFGAEYVASLVASVPEPTSLFAACGLALPLLSRRRRQA